MPDIKLTIAVPTAGMVRMGFAYSLAGMVAKVAAQGIPSVPEATVEVRMDVIESSVIHSNREQLVRRALDAQRTHLLFLDDDMVFEPQILDVLFSRRHPVVAVNYLIKTVPATDFVAVSLSGKRIPTTDKDHGIVPVSYTGFGVSLFDLEVFERVPQPWFMPEFMPDKSLYTTEDNPFYRRVREAGFDVYMDHDASKLVSHVGNKGWKWDEYTKKLELVKEAA